MTNDNIESTPGDLFKREEQPSVLAHLFKAIEVAGKLTNLYGAEHPNAQTALTELTGATEELLLTYERATCVFTKNAVIVNEHYFSASNDSTNLFQRLRARGVMAFTFTSAPSPEHLGEFLAFINAEPREIRHQGGPSIYMRKRGITRIVLTESVYLAGEGTNEDEELYRLDWNPDKEDHVIATAINWLNRQDAEKDEEELPKLPVTQILSDPDAAGKLIREAVTKLHASRRENTSGEVASEVVHDLKSLAGESPDEWDKATPQIRKAIAKLPQDMRPSFSGFTFDDEENDIPGQAPHKSADIGEVETMINELLNNPAGDNDQDASDFDPSQFDKFFGMRASEPLSSWRKELQPTLVLASTGRTLETLLSWENSACEHGRIALALSQLIPRALEIGDLSSGLSFAESMIVDADRDGAVSWRHANIRAALQQMKPETLISLVDNALADGSRQARQVATSIVDLCPDMALHFIDILVNHSCDEFMESISKALIKAGNSAIPRLTTLLHNSTPSGQLTALKVLIDIGREWALDEVSIIINGNNAPLALEALKRITKIRVPQVTEICINALSHEALEVRLAALKALGDLRDESALPQITRIAAKHTISGDQTFEQLAAIEALSKIRSPEVEKILKRIATHRPLFGRSKFVTVRQAAECAISNINNNHQIAA